MNLSTLISDLTVDPLSSTVYTNAQTSVNTGVFGLPDWACWIIIGVLLIISGLFSASENTFSNCNKYHFKVLADEGKITPKIIVKLTEQFEDTLTSVLVGNNIVQTIMSFMSAILFYNLCNYYGWGNSVEAILSTVVMAFLVYVISDTIPKILSKAIPNKMAYILAWPDFILGILLFPIILLFRLLLKLIHKIFKIKDNSLMTKESFLETAEEIISYENIEEEEEALFEDNEIKILNRAFAFDAIQVSSVLTPKDKIVSIDSDNLNIKSINKFLLSNNFSRYPVYEDNRDNVIGILSVNTYFKEYADDPHLDIRSIIIQPLFVLETQSVKEIFDELNKEKVHVAMVKNENGELVGMITMEDILDELVGEQNNNNVGGNNL